MAVMIIGLWKNFTIFTLLNYSIARNDNSVPIVL